MDNKVCGVVVTYNPNIDDLQILINSMTSQVDKIIIVDNGSSTDFSGLHIPDKLHFEFLNENAGIGRAQNIGARLAIKNDCKFVCFFDQDSRLEPKFISSLKDAYSDLTQQGIKVGALGPIIIDERSGKKFPFYRYTTFKRIVVSADENEKYIETQQLISSGTFFCVDIWSSESENHEGFFLEYVDTDWCLRLSQKGYKLFGVTKAHLIHKLGDDRKKILNVLEVPIHSTYRYFYVFRNGVYCSFYRKFPFSWSSYNIFRLISFYFIMLMLKKDKLKFTRYVSLGIYDGIRKNFSRKLK
ncbi:glycosyltransferase family 2 protein [Enterobacter roggenkampii]|uniref:glycosyltransferase family 2 protein n=1 Tax=Enterobacter roggenkampii TaxID=1812935 RepID=UPI000578E5A3|nr:glycosyltransferase family 2 protein [Enterobacter roggenkampii]MCK6773483.1 glycosyltransferase family 2 protein [Enterobacter roggenkampii]